jgi:23S rRNA pseudouridine1911/1915/1917 synthase
VLGDPRYGGPAAHHPRWQARRLALHALSLGFDHPVTGRRLVFTSKLPDCMQRFIEQERRDERD